MRRRYAGYQFVLFCDCGLDLAVGEAGGDFVTYFYASSILQQFAVGIEDQGVSAIENGERRERFERGLQAFAADAVLQQNVADDSGERGGAALEFLAHAGEDQAQIVVADGGGDDFPAAVHFFEAVGARPVPCGG